MMSSKNYPNHQWVPVANLPHDINRTNVAMLNNHEIVFVSERRNSKDCKSIYKYNTYCNEWNVLVDYPEDIYVGEHAIRFAKESNKLYIAGSWNEMDTLDIKNKTFHSFSKKRPVESNPILMNVNGTIHKIKGNICTYDVKHLILNEDNNTMDEVYDFSKQENITGLLGTSGIYIRTKEIMLLIGGNTIKPKPYNALGGV
eukprot:318138_1